jgi:hypothetical protein
MKLKINPDAFLSECLCFSKPINEIEDDFKLINVDDFSENYLFKIGYLGTVLQKFLLKQLSEDDLQRWANLIEFHENIIFHEKDKDYINEIIFQLANPDIANTISIETVRKIIARIQEST